MTRRGVLLDTSFFIRFKDEMDPLYHSADGYFRYFLQQDIPMIISTVSIAEYCVGGDIDQLPLKNLQILPFNLNHAKRTGEFARIVFQHKATLKLTDRNIVPNDSKLFAQADSEQSIQYYLSADRRSKGIYDLLKKYANPQFEFIDLYDEVSEFFGVLDLK